MSRRNELADLIAEQEQDVSRSRSPRRRRATPDEETEDEFVEIKDDEIEEDFVEEEDEED